MSRDIINMSHHLADMCASRRYADIAVQLLGVCAMCHLKLPELYNNLIGILSLTVILLMWRIG
jgi:hypothetical protein